MFSMDVVPKRARRQAPKVKTGCKTCKVRRVKCDETKPDCDRCTSTGRKCDGYAPTSGESRVQVWKQSQDSGPQYSISNLAGFGDSIRYLEFYHYCARPALSTNFDRDFWSRITLQMAQSEPTVRHALIALGYLCRTETGSMKHARSKLIADNGRKVVLFHYNKAVRCLVDRMVDVTYSHEIGLVTCLLFVCIEFLQGNYHTGFTHLRNGLKVISERRKVPPRRDSFLTCQLPNDSFSGVSLESLDTTTLIEEKIVPMFVRGIASALMYGVIAEDYVDVPFPKPSVCLERHFSSLFEVQEAGHELRNASILHLRLVGRKIIHNIELNDEDSEHWSNLLACHQVFLKSASHFERQATLSKDEQTAFNALKASHYTTYVYVSCSMKPLETQYDGFLNEFGSILYHSQLALESMVPATPHTAHYTFDISIIPTLYFVALHCRCPTTRRKAVALLERNPPREGLWDAQQHAVVARRAIEIEETNVDPVSGWPVEESRLWSCTINADMDRNGGFWASFLPSRWVGKVDQNGRQRLLEEFFVL